jgi:hypothetical protein
MKTIHQITTAAAAGMCLLFFSIQAVAHGIVGPPQGNEDRKIQFPDTAEHRTIVFDPHTHSVFSDGHVWPSVRIGEALADGLDAIAITEHLEYQPHLADIPHPDRNRAYQQAAEAATGNALIVIKGAEITRDAPAGHMNAIFIEDANTLYRASQPEGPFDARAYYLAAGAWPAQQAVQAANDQGAFVFWNHPYWGRDFPNGIPVVPDFHADNARNGLLHGIEIANGSSYSEETFRIALDLNLTLMGVSDVHNLIDWDYAPHTGGHRPVTLVLAEDGTQAAIKDALFKRRTVVWFKNMLMGRPEHLYPLLAASLTLDSASYLNDGEILVVSLTNHSDASLQLRSQSPYSFYRHTELVTVPPHETLQLGIKTGTRVANIKLAFDVLNALTAPREPARIVLESRVKSRVDAPVKQD